MTAPRAYRSFRLFFLAFALFGPGGCATPDSVDDAALEVVIAFADEEGAALGRLPPEVVRAEIQVIAPETGALLATREIAKTKPPDAKAVFTDLPTGRIFVHADFYNEGGVRLGYQAQITSLSHGSTHSLTFNLLLVGSPNLTEFPPEERPQPTRLAFALHPQDHIQGERFDVVLFALDQNGQLAPTASAEVTLSGEGLEGAGALSLREGKARFSGLYHTASGEGFTLSATAAGLEGAVSLAYRVSSRPEEPVDPPTLISIEIVPPLGLTAPGSFRHYRALGRYDDESVKDLTLEVSWASDSPDVTFASAGTLEPITGWRADVSLGAAPGSEATITASFEGHEVEAALRINLFVFAGTPSGVQPLTVADDGVLALNGPLISELVANPGGLMIHPNGVWAYILNTGGDTGAYLIEEDGTLTPNGSAPAGGGTSSGAIVGDYLYAHNANPGTISCYLIHPDGSLSLNGAPVSIGKANGFGTAAHPSGRYVYVASASAITTFTVEEDGRLSRNGPDVQIGDRSYIAVDPAGSYLFAAIQNMNELALFRIEEDGTLSANGPNIDITDGETPGDPRSVSVDREGSRLYISNYNNNIYDPNGPPDNFRGVLAYTIEPDGRVTLLDSGPSRQALRTMTLDPAGRFAWGIGLFSLLDLFHIGPDGTLTRMPEGDLDLGDQSRFISATP